MGSGKAQLTWFDEWPIGTRVKMRDNGTTGSVVGCIEYESDGEPKIVRRELEVKIDGYGSATRFSTLANAERINADH